MYLTNRDREILKFVEEYGSITINQCSKVFFKNSNNENSYYQARKRLKLLADNKYIKRYRKDMKSECIYYLEEKLSVHDLKVLDIYSVLIKLGANIKYFKTKYIIPTPNGKNEYREADALIEFTYQEYFYTLLVEIDYTHFTSKIKLLDIYNSNHFQEKYKKLDEDIFPTVLIIRPVVKERFTELNLFDVVYMEWDKLDIQQVL